MVISAIKFDLQSFAINKELEMLHARADYDRFQDPEGKIGDGEPVFIIRAQDDSAPATLRFWAEENRRNGGDVELSARAETHADAMEYWQDVNGSKPADL
jgi:hypothetical protein